MFVVGLTGGIGSGKTATSDIFESLGINIVDADIVAREIVEPGQAALAAIVEHFGPNILSFDNCLDRAKLRTLIFSNVEEKIWLEQLLHPIIRQEIKRQLESSKSEYAILVSPLLFETEQSQLTNRTLLIDVPVEIQLKRASLRDGNTSEQIQKIIDNQLPRDVKLAKADDVICNDKDFSALELKVKEKHKFYLDCAHDQETRS